MDLKLDKLHIISKPKFPGKLLFSNFSSKILADRMKHLEIYLNDLGKSLNLLEFPEALEFFEIKTHTKDLLKSLEYNAEEPAKLLKKTSTPQMLLACREEMQRIDNLLKLLAREPLIISNVINEFEQVYFNSKFRFTKAEIEHLLWGDQKTKGLLYYCGNSQCIIGSNYCLNFFIKLLKYEYNSLEADKFIAVYSNTNPVIIKQMNLGRFVKQLMTKDNPGLIAAYYYITYNTYEISDPYEIFIDKSVVFKYEEWVQGKVICSYLSKIQHKEYYKSNTSESKSTSDSEEDDKDYSRNIYKEITLNNIEVSESAVYEIVHYLLGELDNYNNWKIIDKNNKYDFVKAYNHGKNEFRIDIDFHSNDFEEIYKKTLDYNNNELWKNVQHNIVYRGETADVIHSTLNFGNSIEYTLAQTVQRIKNEILVKQFPIILPYLTTSNTIKIKINAAVFRLAKSNDGKSVKFQAIWSLDDSYKNLPEFILYKSGALINEVKTMLRTDRIKDFRY